MNTFSNVAGYKINTRGFRAIEDKQTEKGIRGTAPRTLALRNNVDSDQLPPRVS